MDRDDSLLLAVAEALADGLPVDWQGLREQDAHRSAELDRLRGIEDVARAFRSVREAEPPAE